MDYIIRLTGKISWDGQANGLPPEIYTFLIYKDYDRAVFDAAIEGQMGQFLHYQAMVVQKDQGEMIDIRQRPQDRMMVPMKWIVKIDATVHNLVGELPQADAEGVERYEDGTEPVKQ